MGRVWDLLPRTSALHRAAPRAADPLGRWGSPEVLGHRGRDHPEEPSRVLSAPLQPQGTHGETKAQRGQGAFSSPHSGHGAELGVRISLETPVLASARTRNPSNHCCFVIWSRSTSTKEAKRWRSLPGVSQGYVCREEPTRKLATKRGSWALCSPAVTPAFCAQQPAGPTSHCSGTWWAEGTDQAWCLLSWCPQAAMMQTSPGVGALNRVQSNSRPCGTATEGGTDRLRERGGLSPRGLTSGAPQHPLTHELGQGCGLCSLPRLGALSRSPDGICSWGEGQGSRPPAQLGWQQPLRGDREAEESGAQRNGRWVQHRSCSLGDMVPAGPQVEPCTTGPPVPRL